MQVNCTPTLMVVDGLCVTPDSDPSMPLLYTLRNSLRLRNPRFGCGLGQCGACTVLLEGRPVRSCQIPTAAANGLDVVTIEGLPGRWRRHEPGADNSILHPVQQAFIDNMAAQCGYCLSGWLLSAVALLEHNPAPDDNAVREAFEGLKCRCAMQQRFKAAVQQAAKALQS